MIDTDVFNQLSGILKDFGTRESKKCLFSKISDCFKRENYHSDILNYLFSFDFAKEKLIEWINQSISSDIDYSLYKNGPDPTREERRRDVSIYSNACTHAIVIENKSNDAGDMDQQIIRYIKELKNQGIEIDAVVYLNKYSLKGPDYIKDIETLEKQQGRKILLITQLIGEKSITDNLLDKLSKQAKEPKLKALSMELSDLFWNIIYGENKMTDEELEQLTEFLGKDKNSQKLETIVDAYNSLESKWQNYFVTYARNLTSTDKVFKKIKAGKYSSNCLSIEFFSSGTKFHLDFYFSIQTGLFIVINNIDGQKTVQELKKLINDKWLFEHNDDDSESKTYKVETLFNIEKVKKIIKKFVYQFDTQIDN